MPPKKPKIHVTHGQAHITAKFNNILVNLTDAQGDSIAKSSAGACGFTGARGGTPYAAQAAVEKAVKQAKEKSGLRFVEAYVKGAGSGREAALKTLRACDLTVEKIIDVTPIPYNGCRPPKKRRV